MGNLKQFLIDIDAPAYIRACKIEGRLLTEEEFEMFCDAMYNEPTYYGLEWSTRCSKADL